MAITYTWAVPNTDRNIADGGITTIHWTCTGTETVGEGDDAVTYTASTYGTTGHSPDPNAADFVAYASVTEQNCIDWAKAELDVDAIEAAIAANITEQKTPTVGSGTPWAAE
jgi:hypothetical protein